MSLLESLQSNTPLILDGAMGTELQMRGVDTGLPMWSANALIAHPEIVLQIHSDYLAAGADIITTNTFRTTRRTMDRAHLPDRSNQLTQTAVELALKARDVRGTPRTLIAGSMAPLEDCYRPDLVPLDEILLEEHGVLAHRLARSGVDFLLLETMNTIREASAACRAAGETGLEVVVSFVCNNDGTLLSGEPLLTAVSTLDKFKPTAYSVNCTSPRSMKIALQHLKEATALPFAVYGNVGNPESDFSGWEFTHDISEDQYASHARTWAAMGASIIGGCCGTTPGFIATLASVLGKR
jgi:S-methylmethionine-dependent homocysteine/selenocysteine methylase